MFAQIIFYVWFLFSNLIHVNNRRNLFLKGLSTVVIVIDFGFDFFVVHHIKTPDVGNYPAKYWNFMRHKYR